MNHNHRRIYRVHLYIHSFRLPILYVPLHLVLYMYILYVGVNAAAYLLYIPVRTVQYGVVCAKWSCSTVHCVRVYACSGICSFSASRVGNEGAPPQNPLTPLNSTLFADPGSLRLVCAPYSTYVTQYLTVVRVQYSTECIVRTYVLCMYGVSGWNLNCILLLHA